MMQPKRTKFRKRHKGRNDGLTKGGAALNFGAFGMKATTNARITARQIEAARRAITRHLKRAGRVWIRIFPDQPVSKISTLAAIVDNQFTGRRTQAVLLGSFALLALLLAILTEFKRQLLWKS